MDTTPAAMAKPLLEAMILALIAYIVSKALPFHMAKKDIFFLKFIKLTHPTFANNVPCPTTLANKWLPKLHTTFELRVKALWTKHAATHTG